MYRVFITQCYLLAMLEKTKYIEILLFMKHYLHNFVVVFALSDLLLSVCWYSLSLFFNYYLEN